MRLVLVMGSCWFVLECVKLLFVLHCTFCIVLKSSLGERQAACSGEEVVFICEITGTGRLTWAITPPSDNSITLGIIAHNMGIRSSGQDFTGYFNATIISFSRYSNLDFLANVTSNLSVIASPESVTSRKRILCNDGISEEPPSLLLTIADLPSSPQNVIYNITSYSVDEFSVRVQWEAPSDDGGVDIISYTIAIMSAGKVDINVEITNGTSQVMSLHYNKQYTFEVAASNCNGKGQHASLNIGAVFSCGHPFPPANGSIQPYSSTQVGAEVQYHCDEGHTPREWRTSQCRENGSWTPDPALVYCDMVVRCGHPSPPANGSIEPYSSTQVGAEVQYHCDEGQIPGEWRTSQCQENGMWTPDPALLNCSLATCDTPELPKEAVVTVNGTREGLRMRITCQNGMGGAEFACNKQGQWYLDPAEYGCKDHDIHPDNFNATAIVLSNVATAVIVFCLGVLTGAVVCVCCRKFQCGIERKQRVPPKYIELRDNPAYGPIQRRRQ